MVPQLNTNNSSQTASSDIASLDFNTAAYYFASFAYAQNKLSDPQYKKKTGAEFIVQLKVATLERSPSIHCDVEAVCEGRLVSSFSAMPQNEKLAIAAQACGRVARINHYNVLPEEPLLNARYVKVKHKEMGLVSGCKKLCGHPSAMSEIAALTAAAINNKLFENILGQNALSLGKYVEKVTPFLNEKWNDTRSTITLKKEAPETKEAAPLLSFSWLQQKQRPG
ncbi:MAG: hypothetical protein JWM96_477 [Alphaproteobacteria bacterium]|nr:hypothetical protein [Alphaproteobacteria bacterium]